MNIVESPGSSGNHEGLASWIGPNELAWVRRRRRNARRALDRGNKSDRSDFRCADRVLEVLEALVGGEARA